MNLRPLGYEPNELPGCSTPRQINDPVSVPIGPRGVNGEGSCSPLVGHAWPHIADGARLLAAPRDTMLRMHGPPLTAL